jgi:hypothetical protein
MVQYRAQWRALCEHDNEPYDPIKGGEFLNQLASVSFSRKNHPALSYLVH